MKVEGILVCLCRFLKKAVVSFPADISYLHVEEHPESASPQNHTHIFLHCFALQPGDAETCIGAPASTQDVYTNSHTREHTSLPLPSWTQLLPFPQTAFSKLQTPWTWVQQGPGLSVLQLCLGAGGGACTG